MYAIIETGGKQYRVAEGDIVDVELIEGEEGATVALGTVLFVDDGKKQHVGAPECNFVVKGEIVGRSTGPKVQSLKYKRRKQEHRRWGHRQHYSKVKIVGINSK